MVTWSPTYRGPVVQNTGGISTRLSEEFIKRVKGNKATPEDLEKALRSSDFLSNLYTSFSEMLKNDYKDETYLLIIKTIRFIKSHRLDVISTQLILCEAACWHALMQEDQVFAIMKSLSKNQKFYTDILTTLKGNKSDPLCDIYSSLELFLNL